MMYSSPQTTSPFLTFLTVRESVILDNPVTIDHIFTYTLGSQAKPVVEKITESSAFIFGFLVPEDWIDGYQIDIQTCNCAVLGNFQYRGNKNVPLENFQETPYLGRIPLKYNYYNISAGKLEIRDSYQLKPPNF